jgi:signal transduction histidine kinase/ligand-binding sensor domain-containing protein
MKLNPVARRALSRWWLFLLISILRSSAQAQYRFDHWTADNGLPQNSVRDIVQTRDGYLWLTTFDGLVRFDGVRFTIFNKSNSPGIASNRFTHIFEDRHGDLWASLEADGLARLHQGRFTTYTKGQGLPVESVHSMGDDGQGNLLIISNFQAFRWNQGQFQPANELRLPEWRVSSQQPACWNDSQSKLVCFVDGQLRSWNATELPLSRVISWPTLDSQGNLWFSTPESLIRTSQGRVAQVYTPRNGLPGAQPLLISGQPHPLQAVSRDATGALWLTDLDSMQSQLMTRQPPEGTTIMVIYADREGNYWFGTLHQGLFRARKQTVTAYSAAHGLKAKEVYPLLETRDDALWIGTGNGLFRFKDGTFNNYSGADSFGNYVTALYEDRAGRLWVNGRWRLDDGRFTSVLGAEIVPFAWTMCEDRAGAYWIGTDSGVVRWQDGAVTRYTIEDGLAGNDTKVIVEDAAGGLWLGSYGGLTHYRNGRFTTWTEKDGLPGHTVRALKAESDGTLWIGTYDSGLGRFKDGRFTRYTSKDGLFDNGVFQILEDDAGWFWMSCNRGIYRVRKQELNDFAEGKIKTLTSLAYNKSDGMVNAECNGGRWPAGIRARDGKLWFPTMEGVAMIDPATVRVNQKPPPVVIEDLRINNQSVTPESWPHTISHHPPEGTSILIQPGQENFEIEYTALSFINSAHLRFRYKLEGLDQNWIEAGTRRTAYFSRVPPGSYTFKVIAANSDGFWNIEGQSLRITVLPPFYRTWWFLTLAALSVGGAIFGVFKYRVKQVEQRQAAQRMFARQLLESQEAERKRIAAELHDSLGQNLLVIKNRAMLNSLTLPDKQARIQFTELSDAVAQTLDEVRAISHDLRPPHLDQLGLRTALVAMIEKVAASSPIQFTYELDECDGRFAPSDDITLYRIVQECLNNILKHSDATLAEINLAINDNEFTLTVRDNGRGFTPDGNEQVGLGLQGIAERARILGGTHTVNSAPGQGTTVTVRIELKDK